MFTLTEEIDAGEYNRIEYHYTAFEAKNTEHLLEILPQILDLCEEYEKGRNGLVFVYIDFDTAMRLPTLETRYLIDGKEVTFEEWEGESCLGDEAFSLQEYKHYWVYPDKRFKPFTGENASRHMIFVGMEFSEENFKQRVTMLKYMRHVDWKLPLCTKL